MNIIEFGGQFRVTLYLLAKQDMTLDDKNQFIVELLRKNTKGLSVKNIATNGNRFMCDISIGLVILPSSGPKSSIAGG